jgi:hypothetical protein
VAVAVVVVMVVERAASAPRRAVPGDDACGVDVAAVAGAHERVAAAAAARLAAAPERS